jgi:type II secretory pathway predicted ATPase ExeA
MRRRWPADYADVVGAPWSSRRTLFRPEVGIIRRSAQKPLRRHRHNGFGRVPFGRDIPPSALYRSTAHQEAVARLTWLIDERGFGILTGEVGAGKSVAVRATTSTLDPSRHQAIYCPNPTIGRGLLGLIVSALGGSPRSHRAVLVPQAAEALATAEAERGRRVLVVVEEAHLLQSDQLEDLRMLGNDAMDSRSPAAFLLVGQPTLRRRLRQGALAAVDQWSVMS